MQSIHCLPPAPVISRFVAPWDTSGWYYVSPCFSNGSRLYSNADIYAAGAPGFLLGCEWIVTYDSHAEGFDDKQGVCFHVERPARIYVALDARVSPSFLSGFSDSGLRMSNSLGDVLCLYTREYAACAEVVLPGFKGACHHYCVVARALDEDSCAPCPSGVYVRRLTETHRGGEARWYAHECFCQVKPGCVPDGFVFEGGGHVGDGVLFHGQRAVRLAPGDCARYKACTSGRDELEIDVAVGDGSVRVGWCGVCVSLDAHGAVFDGGSPMGGNQDGIYRLRFLRAGANCELWLNSRMTASLRCTDACEGEFVLEAMGAAELAFFSLRDRTDLPVKAERFERLGGDVLVSSEAQASIAAHPFRDSACLSLRGSATVSFAAIRGQARIETTVKPTTPLFTVLCETRDRHGALALRVAMYRHNLYVSNGTEWLRVFEGHINGMYYPCSNWYRLEISLDIKHSVYDLFIDGARRAHMLALASPVSDVAQVCYLSDGGHMYVKSLEVYDRLSPTHGLMPAAFVHDVRAEPYCARGDGETLDTQAIQRALDDATRTGGVVFLSGGTFFTGELFLRSNVTLFIDRSAVLRGAQDHAQYPLMTPCGSLCANRQLGRAILYGEHLRNVRVMGGGMIDGNGRYRFKMNDPIADRERDARPDHIYIACSEGIVLEDVNFVNAAFWSVVALSCRNVLMERLNVDCMNTPNRDGIDPVDCVDMTIRRCAIIAGDDGLCLKSSDAFGCRNIHIFDMIIQSLASGIKFGTDSYDSLANVTVERCILKNINRCGVSLESVDGAEVANVRMSHLDIHDVGAPLYMALGTRGRRPMSSSAAARQGSMHDVYICHVRCEHPYRHARAGAPREILLVGQSERQAIRNLRFEDIELCMPGGAVQHPPAPGTLDGRYPEYDRHGMSAGHAFTLRYVQGARFVRCTACLEQADVRPFAAIFDSADIELEAANQA